MKRIAIIAEYIEQFEPHEAIGQSLDHATTQLERRDLSYEWLATDSFDVSTLQQFDGLWIAPGSPYRNMHNVLNAIRYAREGGTPLLGTCGGFQHVVLEIALNLLGYHEIGKVDYDPYSSDLFISELTCHLVGRKMDLTLAPDSRVAAYYGSTTTTEQYYCTFGVNPAHIEELATAPVRIVGSDAEGDARIIEIPEHRFFVATLFVPQVRSTSQTPHPLVVAFVRAVFDNL